MSRAHCARNKGRQLKAALLFQTAHLLAEKPALTGLQPTSRRRFRHSFLAGDNYFQNFEPFCEFGPS
jgi:hypothetical protein